MSEDIGRRFTDEEFMTLRDKFYRHMRDEDIKALENEMAHNELSKKLDDIITKIGPVLEKDRDAIGAWRTGKRFKDVFKFLIFWPLSVFGLLKAMEWLRTHLPNTFGE